MEKLIHFLLRSKLLVAVLGILVFLAGFASYRSLPVDAFPDVTPALVQVFTETEGLAPEEVEKYVTYPVEVAMNGLPNLQEVRSISNFGLVITSYSIHYTKLDDAGEAHGAGPGEVHRDGEDVREVHLQGIGGLLARNNFV